MRPRYLALLAAIVVAQLVYDVGGGGIGWAGLRARYDLYGLIGGTGRGRGELENPLDVAMTEQGELAIVDYRRESIVLYKETNRWIRTLGKPRGQGPVELDRPVAVEAFEDQLWVVDQGSNTVAMPVLCRSIT